MGYFAVHIWWNPDGCLEPYVTGFRALRQSGRGCIIGQRMGGSRRHQVRSTKGTRWLERPQRDLSKSSCLTYGEAHGVIGDYCITLILMKRMRIMNRICVTMLTSIILVSNASSQESSDDNDGSNNSGALEQIDRSTITVPIPGPPPRGWLVNSCLVQSPRTPNTPPKCVHGAFNIWR